MIDCLILGDSIAVGVGQARPACQTVAQVGITSGAWLQTLLAGVPRQTGSLVISLGVNDDPSMATLDNLRRLRGAVRARDVVWLLPGLKDGVRETIRTVAGEHGDRVVDTRSQVGPDHLHPTRDGYRVIAEWTERGGGPVASPAPAIRTASRQPAVPRIVVPMNPYGIWPPLNVPFGALPPRDFAYRATPGLLRP